MIDAHPATKWQIDGTIVAATKWRNDVAMGVSPWTRKLPRVVSPEGTIGNPTQPVHVAPSGLVDCVGSRIHGFTPVATTCRPFGTKKRERKVARTQSRKDFELPESPLRLRALASSRFEKAVGESCHG